MDILLPGMSGYEATRIIKSMRNDIPVIAQTANAMPEDREKCVEAGCDDFIAKPIAYRDMMTKIKYWLYD
jgi:CheY-like chemotaxis protein